MIGINENVSRLTEATYFLESIVHLQTHTILFLCQRAPHYTLYPPGFRWRLGGQHRRRDLLLLVDSLSLETSLWQVTFHLLRIHFCDSISPGSTDTITI